MDLYLAATATVALALLAYAASCAWWPFAACWRCDGAGKFARRDGKVWRTCRRCKGSGRRLRLGRRVWNYARRQHREGTR